MSVETLISGISLHLKCKTDDEKTHVRNIIQQALIDFKFIEVESRVAPYLLRSRPIRPQLPTNGKEVQSHGFSWEKDIMTNVYHATPDELKQIKYNSKTDLPATINHLDGCDVSIKTSCSPNAVCMADCPAFAIFERRMEHHILNR